MLCVWRDLKASTPFMHPPLCSAGLQELALLSLWKLGGGGPISVDGRAGEPGATRRGKRRTAPSSVAAKKR